MAEVLEVEASPVEAGALAPSLAPSFEAEFRPAELHANFDALKRWALDVAGGYDGESYDPNDERDVAQAKRDRAYFNGLVRDVDQRRKAVKAEFSRPLAEFEAQCREVTDVLRGASDAAARVVERGERIRVDRKREALEAEYRDFAGELAEAVPFAAIMDERWLNKGFAMPKALDAMRERAARVAADWEQLRAREGEPRHDVAERAFLRTLDLGDALAAQASAVEADGRAAALKAARDEAQALAAAQAAAPAPAPRPVQAPPKLQDEGWGVCWRTVDEPCSNLRINLYMAPANVVREVCGLLDARGVAHTEEAM